MNKIERFVYDQVKGNPKIKKKIRNIYQAFFDILPNKGEYSINPIEIMEGYFFGFHDLQPFSKDNSKVLAVKYNYDEIRMPDSKDYVDVGFFELTSSGFGEFIVIAQTNAWNFHKGCRLQWVNEEEIAFNCTDDGELKAKIVNIFNKSEKLLPLAIDTISPCGKYATSFSYERLERHMPGYGYCHDDKFSFIDDKAPELSGLFLINLDTLESNLIVTLKELFINTKNELHSLDWDHYVTHSEFSHDSKFISFFHRWSGPYKGKRFTEFMLYNISEKVCDRLPTTNLMTSHYNWNFNREIIAYCNYKGQDAHVLFNVDDSSKNKFVAYPEINSDGHQSFANNTSFITDTYPDKWRMAKLYYVDILTNSKKLVASVRSPKKFQSSLVKGHVACDLHPIVSRDGKFICFDTVQTGKRGLAIMKLY